MLSFARFLCLVVSLCGASVAAAPSSRPAKKERPVVIVFPSGTPGLAQTVMAEIARASRYRLLPLAAIIPLLRQRDVDRSLVSRADVLQEEGRQALLSLDQATAEQKLESALQLLQRSFVRFYAPSRLAELHILRGVAALRASRPDLARLEFVAAHQLDTTLELDAHYSPQVRSAFSQALHALPPRPAPTPDQIHAVLKEVPTARLAVVLMIQSPDERHRLAQVLIFDPAKGRYISVESVPLAQTDDQAESEAKALGERLRARLDRAFPPPIRSPALHALTSAGPVAPPTEAARPWYKRWYVWAATGAVLAAAAVTIPLVARREVVDLTVSWPRE